MQHVVVHHDEQRWCAVPANNGANGPVWQWGDELLLGFTRGTFLQADRGHQCTYEMPFESWLARSKDAGGSWTVWMPEHYAGDLNRADTRPAPGGVDFTSDGFVLRTEGAGYHGSRVARWFTSTNRGVSWSGPYPFSGLLQHPQLTGRQFTARTAYLVNGPGELLLFLTVREPSNDPKLKVVLREKTFLARTRDGGTSFQFVSWVVPWDDPYRAAMPAPVRVSDTRLVAAIRRKSQEHNWIDCFASDDDGVSWSFLAKVGDTEVGNVSNGNPPALVRLQNGMLCAVYGNRTDRRMLARYSRDDGAGWGDPQVLRDDFESANGFPDLGYARLFQRTDGRLIAAYFWCTAERPQTHIEATIFEQASG
jgi:hypothetical protein